MRRLPAAIRAASVFALVAAEAVVADPSADALVTAGFELLRGNRPSEAESSFREALKADRSVAGAYFGRAMVAAADKNFARALTYFEREIKNAPEIGETHNNAGVAQARGRNLVAAIVHFSNGADRLGANETLFNNFGRAMDEYFFDRDPQKDLPKEVVRAAEVFERLERQISLNPPQPGMVRFGANWITAEERDRIARQNEQIDAQVAAEQRSIEQILIEIRAIEGEIGALERQLDRLRYHWDLYPDLRTDYKWGQIVAIDTDIARLSGRHAGLRDSILASQANIQQLLAQKVRPSWFTEYLLLDWPADPETPSASGAPAGTTAP